MKTHPTTTLTDKHGDLIEIDTKIAPLIQRLWDLELTTVMSCQCDSGGHVWIMFGSADDAAKFLTLIAYGSDVDLALYASTPNGEGPTAPKDRWYASSYVGTFRNSNIALIRISIRFPPKHLRRVMATLPSAGKKMTDSEAIEVARLWVHRMNALDNPRPTDEGIFIFPSSDAPHAEPSANDAEEHPRGDQAPSILDRKVQRDMDKGT